MKFANAKCADTDLFSGFIQGFVDLAIIMIKEGTLLLNCVKFEFNSLEISIFAICHKTLEAKNNFKTRFLIAPELF